MRLMWCKCHCQPGVTVHPRSGDEEIRGGDEGDSRRAGVPAAKRDEDAGYKWSVLAHLAFKVDRLG